MIKYITNNNIFMKPSNGPTFNLSKELYDRLGEPTHVKFYTSEDQCYIKVKSCEPSDLNANNVLTYDIERDGKVYKSNACVSSCELRAWFDEYEFSHRLYAYGTDTHGGIILRAWDTEELPCKFKLVKKETKMFLANNGIDNHGFRLSMEAYRRLNVPKHISLWVDRRIKRLYITKSYERVGSYPVRFINTSANSGIVSFNALNLKDELRVDMGRRFKYEIKQDMKGRYYVDITGKILPKNSKGLK